MSTSIQKKIAFFPPTAKTILPLEQPRELVGTKPTKRPPPSVGGFADSSIHPQSGKNPAEILRPNRWINPPTPGSGLVAYPRGLPHPGRNSLSRGTGSPKLVFPWKARGKAVGPANAAEVKLLEMAPLEKTFGFQDKIRTKSLGLRHSLQITEIMPA